MVCMSGIIWSSKETKRLKELYLKGNKTVEEVTQIINKEFWKNKEVRSHGSVEKKLAREKTRKQEHSKYNIGQISAKHKKIWELKQSGYKNREIAELCKTNVNTIKSILSYIKHHSFINESKMIDAKVVASGDPNDIRTKHELMDNIQTLEKQLTRARATTSVVVDTVKDVIKKLPTIKPPIIIIKKGMHKPETAMLELSDLHVGEKVLKSDVADTTEYDFPKFKERMDVLRKGILECVDIQRSKIPIDTLDVNVLGDIVTGEDIYLGQNRNIDMELTKQTFEGAHNIAEKLLVPMCKYFKKVRVRTVWGNHGRPAKPGQFHPKTNFDYIVYMFLKEMFRNQSNIEFYIAECPLMLYKLPEAPDYTHLISHGGEVRSWMSLPFYGLQRDAGKYVQLFNMPINFWHLGHHHNKATIDMPYGEQIINGTFVGGSELSVFKMKTKSRPKQLLYGFNNTRGITWRYDIQLTPLVNMKADDKGIFTSWNKDNYGLKR